MNVDAASNKAGIIQCSPSGVSARALRWLDPRLGNFLSRGEGEAGDDDISGERNGEGCAESEPVGDRCPPRAAAMPRRRSQRTSSPEVELCETPDRSSVMAKIVGNMIELKKPIASAAKPAIRAVRRKDRQAQVAPRRFRSPRACARRESGSGGRSRRDVRRARRPSRSWRDTPPASSNGSPRIFGWLRKLIMMLPMETSAPT